MRIDRRSLIIGSLATGLAARAGAVPPPGPLLPEPDEWRYLWPEEPPGRLPDPLPVEEVRERSNDPRYNDRAVFHVRRPRLAIFRPAQPNGASALITPGGSFGRVVMDKEGFETARWLVSRVRRRPDGRAAGDKAGPRGCGIARPRPGPDTGDRLFGGRACRRGPQRP